MKHPSLGYKVPFRQCFTDRIFGKWGLIHYTLYCHVWLRIFRPVLPIIGCFLALSFAGCTTAQLTQTRAIADPLVSAAVAGYAQTYGVPPVLTNTVTSAVSAQFWGMLAQANAGQPIAQGSAIPLVGTKVAAAASKSSTPTVTQLTTALTALGATK